MTLKWLHGDVCFLLRGHGYEPHPAIQSIAKNHVLNTIIILLSLLL